MNECTLCGGTGWRPVERNGWRAVEVCSCRQEPRDEHWWLEQARIPRAFQAKDLADFSVVGKSEVNESLQFALMKARGFV